MKRFLKKTIFFTLALPMLIILFAMTILAALSSLVLAGLAVLENIGDRFQYWAFDIDKDGFINSPYKKTLKEVFLETYRRCY